MSVVIELSSSISIRQVSNQNNPYIAVSARMSQDARAAMAQHIRDEGDTFMLFVPSVYLSLMATPLHQRSNEHAAAIEKLRMCSPIAMREVGDTNDAVAPDLCPLIVSYMTSLAPAELMLIRKSDGDLLAPLIPGVNADSYSSLAELENCGNCGSDSLSVDFLECPAEGCRFCRECLVSFARDCVRDGTPLLCPLCFQPVDSAFAVKQLDNIGLGSLGSAVRVNIEKEALRKTQFECPVHKGVMLTVECAPIEGTTGTDLEGAERARCVHCAREWCKECLRPGHPGMSCKRAEEIAATDPTVPIRKQLEDMLCNRCPKCAGAVIDFAGCFALTCEGCQCKFCAFCCTDCGADAHPHVRECPFRATWFPELPGGEYFYDIKYFHKSAGVRIRKEINALLGLITDAALLKRIRNETLPQVLKDNMYGLEAASFT